MLFDRGSSKLTFKAKVELDKIAKLLLKYKTLQFEIQGHVCCIPPNQKEAIDRDTKKRQLSINRSEAVFKYLVFNNAYFFRINHNPKNVIKPLIINNSNPILKSPKMFS